MKLRRRPTPRAFAILAAGGLLFMAGTTAQAGWLFVLAAGVVGLILGSVAVRQNLDGAAVERTVPVRARVGDEVRVGLRVTNTGRRRLPLLRVTDVFEAFVPASAASERLDPGESNHIEQVRATLRRGRFTGGPCALRAGSPFGFLTSQRTLHVESPIVVVPDWVELTSFPILEPSSIPFDVLHERARTGAGEEYLGVRDYRPGDPPRSVHWRSTARAGRLVVREYEEEVASKVALVLAGRDMGTPPDSAFEALVSAAASIAIYALQTGHPVELTRFDEAGGHTSIDGPHRYAVLDWLASAQPTDGSLTALSAAALTRIGRRGTVVLLAPSVGPAAEDLPAAVRMVQTAGSRVIAVIAKASTWSDGRDVSRIEQEVMRGLVERRISIRVLERGGDLGRSLLIQERAA